MQLKRAAVVCAALTGLLAVAGVAQGYPQFQLSTEDNTRCSQCHFSPVGGGLINSWGREEAADTISFRDSDSFLGDGRVLGGLWKPPSWLAFGGDYRGAFIAKDAPGEEPRFLGFPMQIDLYTRFGFGDFSVSTTAGIRGAARDSERPSVASRIVSREHYVMWRPRTTGPYVRAGRFFAPFGLRLHDHTTAVRRRLGFHSLEETYNISGGVVNSEWEAHGTLFAPGFVFSAGTQAFGAAGYYERRVASDKGAVGAQVKAAVSGDDARYIAGGIAKLYFDGPRLLVMTELDVGLQTFDAPGTPTLGQLAAYANVTWFPIRGLHIGAAIERYDNDLVLEKSARDAVSASVQFFPRAHWEVMLHGKLEMQGDDFGSPARLAMLMLHYYM